MNSGGRRCQAKMQETFSVSQKIRISTLAIITIPQKQS
jgi:hypothetical protein